MVSASPMVSDDTDPCIEDVTSKRTEKFGFNVFGMLRR